MATIREDIDAMDELEQLKALVAEQQLRLEALETHKDSPNGGDTSEKRSTRRQMLKLAGATLVGAAGGAALRAIPATAADLDNVQVGTIKAETLGNATGVNASGLVFNYGGYFSAGTFGTGVGGFNGSSFGTGTRGTASGSFGIGVIGSGNGTFGIGAYGSGYSGVVGYGTKTGVFGSSFASTTSVGVSGNGPTGVAAYTSTTSSRALYAYTAATGSNAIVAKTTATGGGFFGYNLFNPAINSHSAGGIGMVSYGYLAGVWATSGFVGAALRGTNLSKAGGPDLKLSGTGRMLQVSTVTGGVGAPNYTPSSGGYGELVRAYDGALWINSAANYTGVTGQAAWKRVNAVRVDSSDGTGAPFKPARVTDTRSGPIRAKGSTNVVVVAGTGAGTSTIPSDAVAVIGNLTAVNYTGSGFLAIMPAGVAFNPAADPSSVNFIVGQKAIANGFVVGLGTGANAGKVQVFVAGHASHFIIDVTGYLQ